MVIEIVFDHFRDCDQCGSPNGEGSWVIEAVSKEIALCDACLRPVLDVLDACVSHADPEEES